MRCEKQFLLLWFCLFLFLSIPLARATESVTDTFTDSTKIDSSSQIDVSGGQAQLDTYLSAPEGWWNSSWGSCKALTIDSGDIDEVLTDFPILVYLNSSTIDWSKVQDDLDDLRFTLDNSTLLMVELDDAVVNDEAWLWVKIPSVSNTTDTPVFMYYNNPSAVSYWNPESVWDANFVMVQHLKDATTSTVLDSTSNNCDGTKQSANLPLEATGKIGKGQDYPNNGYVNFGNTFNPTSQLTLEFWIRYDGDEASTYDMWIDKGYQSQLFGRVYNTYLWLSLKINGTLKGTPNLFFTAATLTHIAITYDGAFIRGYVNGVPYGTNTAATGAIATSTASFYFGTYAAQTGGAYNIDGLLDELRASYIRRSSAWILASYETQRLDLLTLGEEENSEEIYYDDGNFQSVNLLSGLNVTEITSFTYNCSIAGSEEIQFQFSQNLANWYNSTHINEWLTSENGIKTINLKPLGWKGGFFYYQCNLTSGTTPELYSISLTYSTASVASVGYTSFVFIIGIVALTIGILALSRRH